MNNDEFYLSFENNFRGTREHIINSLCNYDGSLNYCCKNFENPKVLDIGCGRGDWLHKLKEFELDGIGLEINRSMVQSCRDVGLDVLEGDALALMNTFDDHTFAIISIFHVAENLNSDYLDKLLSECRRLVCPDGLLIIETSSIDNLIISTNRRSVDNTQITHINVNELTFRLANLGFKSSITHFINSGPLSNTGKMNLTRVLNGILKDVCIISSLSDFLNDGLNKSKLMIEESFEIGLATLDAASEFDHELNILRKQVSVQNLEIFELRRTLIDLQKSFLILNNFSNKFRNNLFFKLFSYIFRSLIRMKKVFLLFLRNSIKVMFRISRKITPLRLINLIKGNEILLPIFFLIFKRLGMKSLTIKFMKTFSKTKSYATISTKLNERLLKRYKESSNSKKIFNQFKNLL